MVKRIVPQKYRFGDSDVEELDYYLYEYTEYHLYKNRVELINCKYYKSDKFIQPNVKCKKSKDGIKQISFTLIGVPIDFIKQHKLKPYNGTRRIH